MSLKTECPHCGYMNYFVLDDLMGRYASCDYCKNLVRLLVDKSPLLHIQRKEQDHKPKPKNIRDKGTPNKQST